MKLGVMSALFAGRTLEDVCDYIADIGLGAIELPVGAWPGKPYFDPKKVLGSKKKSVSSAEKYRDGLMYFLRAANLAYIIKDDERFSNLIKSAKRVRAQLGATAHHAPALTELQHARVASFLARTSLELSANDGVKAVELLTLINLARFSA